MSNVRYRLLITLVHGTWPRGLFPKIARFKQWVHRLMRRKRLGPPPFWFEEGSPFLARLSTELGDIPHKITPLLWSGANSIFVRDTTAHVLAGHLSAEHAEHPEATRLIIAHSHGGNIALRAIHHLRQRNAFGVWVFGLVFTLWWGFWWVNRRAAARQNRVQIRKVRGSAVPMRTPMVC